MSDIRLFFDGSCTPVNPAGMAAYGYHISVDNVEFASGTGKIDFGVGNNYAEFYAIYKGLEKINTFAKKEDFVFIKGDSLLVINILKKRWRFRLDKLYYPAFVMANDELSKLRQKDIAVCLDWIPRAQNERADELSKK